MQTPGEILKAEREKRGLSLKDVEQATSIRTLYLNAIEEGNYTVVPGEVYLKGFIRNYATHLGLNAQEMVELYRQQTQPSATPPAASGQVQPAKEMGSITTAPQKATTVDKVKQERASSSPLKWVAVAAVAVTAAAGWWFTQSSPETPSPNSVPKPSPTAPVKPTPLPAPGATQPHAQPAPALTKPVVVAAKFTDECWTLVTADGKEVYEGIPKVGETITWEAQQNITLKLGNANGAEITYNGAAQGTLGGKGDVVTKTFTPKS